MAGNKITAQEVLSPEVIKEFQKLNKELEYTLSIMGSLSKEFIKSDTALKNSAKTINDLNKAEEKSNNEKKKLSEAEKELLKTEKLKAVLLDKSAGYIAKLRAENKLLYDQKKNLVKTDADYYKQIEKINKKINENGVELGKLHSVAQKNVYAIRDYAGSLDTLVPGIGTTVNGIKQMTIAALKFIATPLGLILAGIAIAISAVIKYFKNSEEGQNRLTKITTILSAALQGLWDILSKVGEILVDAFLKPKDTIEWLKGAIKDIGEFFTDTFGNIIMGAITGAVARIGKQFAFIGLAWQKVKGFFTDNVEGIKKAEKVIDDYNKKIQETNDRVSKGWNNLKEDVTGAFNAMKKAGADFIAEEKRLAELGAKHADLSAALRKKERKELIENSKFAKESSALRAKAEEIKKTNAEESIKLAEKAMLIDEKILQQQLDNANEDLHLHKLKGEFSKQDIEYLDKLAELQVKVNEKELAFTEARRGRYRQLNRLRMEAFNQEKDRLAAELAINKNNIEQYIGNNEKLIDLDTSTYQERMKLLLENNSNKVTIIQDEFNIEKKQLDKELELKLISEKDYDLQLRKIKSDRDKKIFDDDLKTYNETKNIQAKRISDMDRDAAYEITQIKKKNVNKLIDEKELQDSILKIQMESIEEELKLADLTFEQKIALEEKLAEYKTELNKKVLDDEIANVERTQEIFQGLTNFQNTLFDAQNTRNEEAKKRELELAGDNEKKKEQIEKKYAAKNLALRQRQATFDKFTGLFNIAINTAVAVTKALAENKLLVPWIIAQGAIQAGIVAAKPIPKFAKGVRNFEGGYAEVGELGTELIKTPAGDVFLTPNEATKMILPKGSDVFTHTETKEMLGNGVSVGKWDEMIKEQKETRKALSKQTKDNLKITPRGWVNTHETINGRIVFIDKYFRC